MKQTYRSGFTIIETMLFLAITGLLVVAVLVGTGATINRQRYRDSITSLQSIIQQQYSEVSSVNNDRDNSWVCDSASGAVTKLGSVSSVSRGQSGCVVLGKLISSSDDGLSLIISDVIGSEVSNGVQAETDVKALAQYKMHVSPVAEETYEIEWGSSLVKPGSDQNASFSVLILQSPLSGVVRTFNSPNMIISDSNINSIISKAALTEPVKICVNSNGLFSGTRMAIVVTAGSSSAAGVESLGEASGC
jgi:hypothetical protein